MGGMSGGIERMKENLGRYVRLLRTPSYPGPDLVLTFGRFSTISDIAVRV